MPSRVPASLRKGASKKELPMWRQMVKALQIVYPKVGLTYDKIDSVKHNKKKGTYSTQMTLTLEEMLKFPRQSNSLAPFGISVEIRAPHYSSTRKGFLGRR